MSTFQLPILQPSPIAQSAAPKPITPEVNKFAGVLPKQKIKRQPVRAPPTPCLVKTVVCGKKVVQLSSNEDLPMSAKVGLIGGTLSDVVFRNPPSSRYGFSAFALDDETVILAGGITTKKNEFEVYHLKLSANPCTWKQLRIISPSFGSIFMHSTMSSNDNLYIFGGTDSVSVSNQLILISFNNDFCCARTISGNINTPAARCDHTMILHNGNGYLFGGQGENGELFNDLWELDISIMPLNPQWHHISTQGPPCRHGHISFEKDHCIYVAGGYGEDNKLLRDLWKYDGVCWQQIAVFDYSDKMQIYGCLSGFYYTDAATNQVKEIVNRPALTLLDDKFNQLKTRQLTIIQMQRDSQVRIQAMREEIQFLKNLTRDYELVESKTAVSSLFSPQIKSQLETQVVQLRNTFITKANQILMAYCNGYLQPPVPKPDTMIDDYIKHLESEYSKATERTSNTVKQYTQEFALISRMNTAASPLVPPSAMTNTSAPKGGPEINGIPILEDTFSTYHQTLHFNMKLQKLESLQAKISKRKEQLHTLDLYQTAQDFKLMTAINDINNVRQQIESKDNKIKFWTQLIDNTKLEMQKYQSLLDIKTRKAQTAMMIRQTEDKVQKENEQLQKLLEDTFTNPKKMAVRSLGGMFKMLTAGAENNSIMMESIIPQLDSAQIMLLSDSEYAPSNM